MAAPNDTDSLRAAWRALSAGEPRAGWRTIPITVRAPCTFLAGKRMPGGHESLLIGFRDIRTIPDSGLPQGRGFEIRRLGDDPTGAGQLMLALTRREGGSSELFAMMAKDLVELVDGSSAVGEHGVLHGVLERIRAWQEFMDRHKEGVLSAEDEQGLFGELVVLERMMELGVPATEILEAWQGPRDGLHDFMLGTGAIEVKSTIAADRFLARISSLDQLDENLRQPVFLAAVRLALRPSGITILEMADAVRLRLRRGQAGLATFETRLMQAGLVRPTAERYTRRFLHASTACLALHKDFPRLTRTNVHSAITTARYEIDLGMTGADDVGLKKALESLGAI